MRNQLSTRLGAAVAALVLGSPLAFAQAPGALRGLPGGSSEPGGTPGIRATLPPPDQPVGPVRQLTVEEAVRLALEQNLGVQAARLNPQLQDLVISQVRGSWVPMVSSTVNTSSANSPVSNVFAGAASKLTTDQFVANIGLNQQLPTGGTYSVGWDAWRSKSNNVFSTRNPSLGADLNLSFTQPLLRNFRIDNVRQQLQVSQKNREITDLQLRQTVLTTTRSVRNAYWALSYAVNSLAVQRQSLELAQESLRNNRSRVNIGTMAPIDIIEAQAEVAAREEAVIIAEASVSQAEDQLRALILDPKTPDFWTLKLELTDTPTFETRAIDVEAAVRSALESRTDMIQARKSLQQTDVNIKYYRNQTLPDLNVQANYGASALGGTEYDINPNDYVHPVATLLSETGYTSVLSSMFRRDFPTWSVAVQVGYPIGRSAAEAAIARARLQRQQQDVQLRNLELQVATQVRDLGRQVNTNVKRVEATRAARELAERRLEAEQKKLAAGMGTNFLVFQAQRDLAQARNAELSAILDYNRSLVDFETGQLAPLGGSAVSVTTAGSTTGMSGGF